jgi:ribokinase
MLDIVVVGSMNMDLVVRVNALPAPGETVLGRDFATYPGGKGTNQAVAAARLGAGVAMVGRIGEDPFGEALKHSLASCGADISRVGTSKGEATGTALITVDQAGQNTIVVASGANNHLTLRDIKDAAGLISRARVLLLQLEIPQETVAQAIAEAAGGETKIILNPAPPRELPDELLKQLYCLIPNEIEAERLTGVKVADQNSAKQAAQRLLKRGAPRVIITLGDQGALLADGRNMAHIPARKVNAVDATAAGDAFIGCLAAELAASQPLEKAAGLASACGALTASRHGAQASLPTRKELESFAAQAGAIGNSE